jgi:hypothetical protein
MYRLETSSLHNKVSIWISSSESSGQEQQGDLSILSRRVLPLPTFNLRSSPEAKFIISHWRI